MVLAVEVSSFDLRFGGGIVRDRYLFYVTPLLLCAFAAAPDAPAACPAGRCAAARGLLAVGFWETPLPSFAKLNVDTPAAVLNNWLVETMRSTNGARVFLLLAVCVVTLLYIEGGVSCAQTCVAIGLSVLLLVALPAETGYAFKRLFAVNGTSGLPMTLDQSIVFGWVDREITTHSRGGDGAVPGDPRRLLGGHRVLVGLRVLEPIGRPRGGPPPAPSRARRPGPSRSSPCASTRKPARRASTSPPTSRRPPTTPASTSPAGR